METLSREQKYEQMRESLHPSRQLRNSHKASYIPDDSPSGWLTTVLLDAGDTLSWLTGAWLGLASAGRTLPSDWLITTGTYGRRRPGSAPITCGRVCRSRHTSSKKLSAANII